MSNQFRPGPFLLRASTGDIDWQKVVGYIAWYTEKIRFQRTVETEWAYARVLTHLDDGWTALRSYVEIKPELDRDEYDINLVGVVANRIVGGTRACPDESVPYVGAGEYPTPLDVAAFWFYHTTLPPSEQRPEKTPSVA